MLNYLWGGMLVLGILWGTVTGNISEITDGLIEGSGTAVSLGLTMAGIMSFWMGLMEIASESGLVKTLAGKMEPFLKLIFPGLSKDHPAKAPIAMNIIANILGLGWAATPSGLEAIKQLKKDCPDSRIASREMCALMVLNISSLQLIPVNVIAYRNQYGAINPAAIVGPAIGATAVSTLVGILFIILMNRMEGRKP